jgi:hypothetical protein
VHIFGGAIAIIVAKFLRVFIVKPCVVDWFNTIVVYAPASIAATPRRVPSAISVVIGFIIAICPSQTLLFLGEFFTAIITITPFTVVAIDVAIVVFTLFATI